MPFKFITDILTVFKRLDTIKKYAWIIIGSMLIFSISIFVYDINGFLQSLYKKDIKQELANNKAKVEALQANNEISQTIIIELIKNKKIEENITKKHIQYNKSLDTNISTIKKELPITNDKIIEHKIVKTKIPVKNKKNKLTINTNTRPIIKKEKLIIDKTEYEDFGKRNIDAIYKAHNYVINIK